MLSSRYRISKKYFPQVLRGKTYQNDLFRVVFHYNDMLTTPKIGVVVPTKIVKTAVARNYTKRLTYSFLEKELKKIPNHFITIFPKESLYKTTRSLKEIKNSLLELCLKK